MNFEDLPRPMPRHDWTDKDLICIGCGRHPSEIEDYAALSWDENMLNAEYVLQEEGTLNRENGHFACDQCYIKMGMPTSPGGWVAP